VGPKTCRGTGPRADRIVGRGRRSRPLPKDRRRCLRAQEPRGGPGLSAWCCRAGRGTPKGLRLHQGPQSGSWLPAPRERGTGASESLEGPDEIRAHSGREVPSRGGVRALQSIQRCKLAGIAPLARPSQSELCGVLPRVRQGACSAAAPDPCGSAGWSTPTALQRVGGLLRGRVRGVRARRFPKEAPVRNPTEVEKRRGWEMGDSYLTRAELRENSGDTVRGVALPGQPGRSQTARGRKPAPRL